MLGKKLTAIHPTHPPFDGHFHFMVFSSFDLDLLNLEQLKELAQHYGLAPIGNPGFRQSWLNALNSFDTIALRQFEQGKGIKRPNSRTIDTLIDAIAAMGSPTDEQRALISVTVEQRYRLADDLGEYKQDCLLKLYLAQNKIKEAIAILTSI